MNIYIKYLMGIIAKAENQELTLPQAITYTMDLESSLIEKTPLPTLILFRNRLAVS